MTRGMLTNENKIPSAKKREACKPKWEKTSADRTHFYKEVNSLTMGFKDTNGKGKIQQKIRQLKIRQYIAFDNMENCFGFFLKKILAKMKL